jgi:hexosaminidase
MDYNSINYNVDALSPGTPGTFKFVETILTEVMSLFPSQYIHCGGDEVTTSVGPQWNTYTPDVTNMEAQGITPNGTTSVQAYQRYFSTNIANFLQANGRTMMGWTEFEASGIISNAVLADWQTGTSAKAVAAATNGAQVVMCTETNCYFNYVETTTNIEPYFIVGGAPVFLPLTNVYAFEPIPTNLPAQYSSNILGAEGTLFAEYVPSLENALFKYYPRLCAMSEVTWTPAASKNYTSFTNRLVTHEQRLTQMGVNYNHETIPQIGTWGPNVPASPTIMNWDITTNVTAAGEIDVNFFYTNGTSGLNISSVALLQNGVQVSSDVHDGFAMNDSIYELYILNLPETKPGATYTIQAVISGSGGTNSSGIIYLPNWN